MAQDALSEGSHYPVPRFGARSKSLVTYLVGIDDHRSQFRKHTGYSALAAGDSAGKADDDHNYHLKKEPKPAGLGSSVSFIGAAVVTRGEIRIRNACPEYLEMIGIILNRLGVHWIVDNEDILVPSNQSLVVEPDLGDAIPEISVMPWPSFPTDLMSIAIVIATQAKGSVLFHDWMYPSRMFFIDKLVNMGAQIVLCDPHRCIVQGPTTLYGEKMESPNTRAGMSLMIAALSAEGQSVIRNVGQIDRGYERVDDKLRSLGARIERVER